MYQLFLLKNLLTFLVLEVKNKWRPFSLRDHSLIYSIAYMFPCVTWFLGRVALTARLLLFSRVGVEIESTPVMARARAG